jgi:hypothetical protein
MTLVACSENCEYQKDGYCQTPENAVATNSTNNNCCYYNPKAQTQSIKTH